MPVSATLTKKPGNTRVTGKEQYYTPSDLAIELVEIVDQTIGLSGKTLLEPAGGTGAFISAAENFGIKEVVSFDIEPLHPKVQKGDFLQAKLSISDAITISNPPFGRNNALSIPFFNRAAEVSNAICFIVPRSWRKWSVTNRLNLNFDLVFDQDLKIDYVSASGEEISGKNRLATCFQIWKRIQVPRSKVIIRDMGIVSRTIPSLADVSLTTFGYGCGKVKTNFAREANTTQLFLKLNHPRALEALEKVDYSRFYRNTAYTEALSLQEINFLLNEYLFGNPMIEKS